MWLARLNAVLGSLVVTLGLWLMWGELPLLLVVALALGSAGFLVWRATSLAAVWAWVTLLVGLESLAWPLVTMVQIRMTGPEPSEEQIGLILTAVLFGVFSSIFWLTFSYGLFQCIKRKESERLPQAKTSAGTSPPKAGSKKKRKRLS